MIDRLSEPQVRTLGFIAGPIVVVVSTLFAYSLGSYSLAVIVAIFAFSVVAVSSHALTPPWFGRTRAQIYSLAVLSTTAIAVLAPDTLWVPIIEALFKSFGLQPPTVPDFRERSFVLLILAFAVITLNFFWYRQKIAPPSNVAPNEVDSQFNNSGYQTLRNEFCNYMVSQLDQYDRDVHWSDSDYQPLEAEIEIERQGALRPKVVNNLIRAIQNDHDSRAFLLLGDPGSGKSVSLRRLCRELYAQVRSTGIVPVYVNLREWDGPAEPSDQDVSSFVLRHLKFQSGRSGIRFLETWFEGMLDRGLFFFILDSFDEMPAVLDCDDASNRLQTISKGFDRFFNDLHHCRGVLSSRFFRQPRGFRGRRLTIRPFSETQVRKAMRRWLLGQPVDADQILLQLFREKPGFSSIVRNPFSADLVAQFLAHNPGQLPNSYFSVFEDYITRRLKEDTASLKELELAPDQVLSCATHIAWEMYRADDVGLDVEVNKLRQLVDDPGLERHLTALRISRLARLGGVRIQRFSFAHRRLAEFFVVRKLIIQATAIPLSSIPADSRWRDCLVVYCGIAPEANARSLAEFSWNTFRNAYALIKAGDLVASRPAIHCLRFLIDGFRGRLECTSSFQNELTTMLLEFLKYQDLLVAKIAAEGLCLVHDTAREEGLATAVERGIGWISETAIRSCRHFGTVGKRSQKAIETYIRTLPTDELFRRFADLSFSLSLSDGFHRIRAFLAFETFSIPIIWLIWAGCLLHLMLIGLNPMVSYRSLTHTVEGDFQILVITIAFTMILAPIILEMILAYVVLSAPMVTGKSGSVPVGVRRVIYRIAGAPGSFIRSTIRLGFDTSVRIGVIISVAYSPIFLHMLGNVADTKIITDSFLLPVLILGFLSWRFFETAVRLVLLFVAPKKLLHLLATIWADIPWKDIASAIGFIILFGAGIGGIGWLFYNLLGEKLFSVLLVVLSGVIVVPAVYALIRLIFFSCLAFSQDWKFLKVVEIPRTVTRPWVYQMCEALKSHWGRKRFLDVLLARGVRAEDAPIPLPDETRTNAELRERFAKLEERWLSLET